jgi:hypothetical protein
MLPIQGRTRFMALESWLVVTIAAAFFLLGIAASPLAWMALVQRRSRSEGLIERRFSELAGELSTLQVRLNRCEAACQKLGEAPPEPVPARQTRQPRRLQSARGVRPGPVEVLPGAGTDEPPLIAVPSLAAPSQDREATLSSLTQRHSAIWALADSGASTEVIARATGQPIGQIELILGLRRKIAGARTTIPHGPHD